MFRNLWVPKNNEKTSYKFMSYLSSFIMNFSNSRYNEFLIFKWVPQVTKHPV